MTDYKFRTDLDRSFAEDKALVPVTIAVEVLRQTEGFAGYEAYVDGLKKIDGIVRHAQEQVKERALRFAETYKDDKIIYTMGSGASYGQPIFRVSVLYMEMQWVNSSSIHTGEVFSWPL